jgi:hypothetical protein
LWEGRLGESVRCLEEAAGLTTDPYELLPWTARSLALAYAERIDEALAVAQHAQVVADQLGNPTMMALARYSLGEALTGPDPHRAAGLFDEAMRLARRVDNRMVLGVAGVSITSPAISRRSTTAGSASTVNTGSLRAATRPSRPRALNQDREGRTLRRAHRGVAHENGQPSKRAVRIDTQAGWRKARLRPHVRRRGTPLPACQLCRCSFPHCVSVGLSSRFGLRPA